MDHLGILPHIGDPVDVEEIHATKVGDLSLGHLAYGAAFFASAFAKRLADPASIQEIATFHNADGADWSGYLSVNNGDKQNQTASEVSEPTAPDNYVDTLPAIFKSMARAERTIDAALTHLVPKVDTAIDDQTSYFGAPDGVQAFRDTKAFLKRSMQHSGYKIGKLINRAAQVAHTIATDRTTEATAPKLPELALAFTAGEVPVENLEHLARLDADLTKYSRKTGQGTDYKDRVLEVFEPQLVEAATQENPDTLRQAKQSWMETIAYHIDEDGPPPSEVLVKQPDNALHVRKHEDGSATASMHMDPGWAAYLDNFLTHNLNFKGDAPLIPEPVVKIYEETADKTQQDEPSDKNDAANHDDKQNEPQTEQIPPEGPMAEDPQGNRYMAYQLGVMGRLSIPQRAGAVLLGCLHTVLSMPAKEALAKGSHGTPTRLVIVQDIQTAHITLGFPALPEAVRRPDGPEGAIPNIAKPPDLTAQYNFTEHTETDGDGFGYPNYVNRQPWTPYQSSVINVGPIHPKVTEPFLCDTELSGQIWNGPDIVLNEYRSKRHFTSAQRKAILARDKGCQIPGCTIAATYCQCHHCKEWSKTGHTNVANATTLCPHHHRDVHDGNWTIRKIDGMTYFQPAPWIDPARPLLRNLYWDR